MKRRSVITAGLLFAAFAVLGALPPASGQGAWTTLFDGKNLDNWNPVGNANWRLAEGAVTADKGGRIPCLQEFLHQLRDQGRVLGRRCGQ